MSAPEISVVFTNLNDAVHVQPGLQRLFHSANVIGEVFPGGVGFGVLTEGDLADLAVDMAGRILRFDADIHQNLLNHTEKKGTRTGVLKVAQPCDDTALAQIREQLENLLACHLDLTVEVDPALVGGFSALVEGKVYDFSYRAQLSNMQHRLA